MSNSLDALKKYVLKTKVLDEWDAIEEFVNSSPEQQINVYEWALFEYAGFVNVRHSAGAKLLAIDYEKY